MILQSTPLPMLHMLPPKNARGDPGMTPNREKTIHVQILGNQREATV